MIYIYDIMIYIYTHIYIYIYIYIYIMIPIVFHFLQISAIKTRPGMTWSKRWSATGPEVSLVMSHDMNDMGPNIRVSIG